MPISLKAVLKDFFKTEAAGGVLLFAAAVAAILVANSSLHESYLALFAAHLGPLSVAAWINDGLMAIFFFLVGMEIKSELTEGSLASLDRAILPAAGALGGMILPVLIYFAFAHDRGWGIPMATDIAFAVGVLALVGRHVPSQLKVFLLALAIADDLGAVLVIAFFYTETISLGYLTGAAVLVTTIFLLSRLKVRSIWIHLPLGVVFWFLVHHSGVHATIAGCILGFLVPQPRVWIDRLHGWSSFVILPLFAFANAGLSLSDVSLREALTSPLVNGICYGLLVGKPFGIFGASWLAVRFGWARADFRWRDLAGVACLGGIGFTMSLFISALALNDAHSHEMAKVGIVMGSLGSAFLGSALLIGFRQSGSRTAR